MKNLFIQRLAVALAVLTGPAVHAQTPSPEPVTTDEGTETNRPPIVPFLEGTDVFWTVQRGNDRESIFPNKLEADIFPHLIAAQNFTDVLNIDEQARRGDIKRVREFSYSISGTPAVRIRMLRETSAPVRTPSYMPRGNFQLLWVRGLKDCDPSNPKSNCKPVAPAAASTSVISALAALPRVSIWEAHVIVGHHSNGQEGCLSVNQQRDPPDDGPCVPPTVVTAETVNRINGSFSTNYVRWGGNYSRNWMSGSQELQAVREARARVEFEHHPRAWMDPDVADLYGRFRMNFAGAYAARDVRPCRRRLEGSAALLWNPNVTDGVDKTTWTLQASCFPTNNGGWGFFVRWYHGQDYYNVGFLDNIARVHIGATFNQSGFFRFRRPAASAAK